MSGCFLLFPGLPADTERRRIMGWIWHRSIYRAMSSYVF